MDAVGIMRIGGRLQNAYLREEEKHPAVIPTDSRLAELLIRDAHLRTLQCGPQLVTSYLLRAYWIVRARNRIATSLTSASNAQDLMGEYRPSKWHHFPPCA